MISSISTFSMIRFQKILKWCWQMRHHGVTVHNNMTYSFWDLCHIWFFVEHAAWPNMPNCKQQQLNTHIVSADPYAAGCFPEIATTATRKYLQAPVMGGGHGEEDLIPRVNDDRLCACVSLRVWVCVCVCVRACVCVCACICVCMWVCSRFPPQIGWWQNAQETPRTDG